MKQRIELLIIDPQNDFMDQPDAALRVPGATDDMKRLAAMTNRIGRHLSGINVTLDSHQLIDIAHPAMWVDGNGNPPNPFVTTITPDDIKAGIWRPRHENAKPADLGGKTIGEYVLWYTEQLQAAGLYDLTIWAPHCIIGTPGHNIQPDLMEALNEWSVRMFATINYVTKGTNVFTEHYGAMQAEVPMSSDPSSALNQGFLSLLQGADIVLVAGEALSHCVKATVTQIAENIGQEHIAKFHILRDCSSPIPKIGDGPDFPAITEAWLKEMEKLGMTVTTSTEFLA